MTEKTETTPEFAKRLTGILSNGQVSLALSVGSKTGLLEKLMTYEEPKTCKEIADGSKMKERYVREWLGVMTTGNIIDIHKDNGELKFILPKHMHHVLSDTGEGMAIFASLLTVCGQSHDEIVECFKQDGPLGVPYKSYPGFHENRLAVMKNQFTPSSLTKLFEVVPGLMENLEKGITICDLGCGAGYVVMLMAEMFPKSKIYGVDIGESAIEMAKKAAKEKALTNCYFQVADICNMPDDLVGKFDFAYMLDVLHDIPYVSKGLLEIHKTLKDGAYFSVLDITMDSNLEGNIGNPVAPMIYGVSLFHCLAVSLNSEGSEGMGAAWGCQKAQKVLEIAGFKDITKHQEMGINTHFVSRK